MLRFGVYEVDLRTGELRKRGTRLKLQEQPFQVLALMLQRRGDLVTRDELRERLWPADTFVDFDHGLNTCINKLRETLGDSANSPTYIETLPRRGYRFIAPVVIVMETVESDAVPVVPSTTEPLAAASTATPTIISGSTNTSDLPVVPRWLSRGLFLLAQIMYLGFYVAALVNLHEVFELVAPIDRWPFRYPGRTSAVIFVSALAFIPVRLFFVTAVAFDYQRFGEKYARMFLYVVIADLWWAFAPLLMAPRIGIGLALAVVAALLYLPFGQRTLVRMAYGYHSGFETKKR